MITDEEIFEILDGTASNDLLAIHSDLIKESNEYKIRFDEFEKMDSMFASLKLESPSSQFTANLLSKLTVSNSTVYSRELLKVPFYFLGSFIFVAVLVTIFVLKASQNAVSDYDFNFDFNIVNNLILKQALLVINGIVFLLVLDKWIIKKYFQSRLS